MNFTNYEMINAIAGLGGVTDMAINDWIAPAFFLVVAGFAIKFVIQRQFRELAAFLVIAAIVGLLIFNGDGLFGEGGIFYGVANKFSSGIGEGGGGSGGAAGFINMFFTSKS